MSTTILGGYAARWGCGRWSMKVVGVADRDLLPPVNVELRFNV
jgi:hypothetical protein